MPPQLQPQKQDNALIDKIVRNEARERPSQKNKNQINERTVRVDRLLLCPSIIFRFKSSTHVKKKKIIIIIIIIIQVLPQLRPQNRIMLFR